MTTNAPPELEGQALGLAESVVMGVAGTAPAFSIAATTATLIGAVGPLAPASLLYCGLIMFGVTFAYLHLNRLNPSAGAAYAWVGAIFNRTLGFFAGWALLVASVVFMVSGTIPAATATLTLIAPPAGGAAGGGGVGGRGVVAGGERGHRQGHQADQLFADRHDGDGDGDPAGADRAGAGQVRHASGARVFADVAVARQLYAPVVRHRRADGVVLLLGLGCDDQPDRGDARCQPRARPRGTVGDADRAGAVHGFCRGDPAGVE
ncbi:probable amino acid transporter transmembrane protein [Ralstonia solanacearum IPO1609]|uniref:Probable amino acid transporter transmembrane protein n=1 Tax=Ralstonia solanacearum IPO1609 TaxID=564066 RepID=A0A7U7PQV4_RALSL|nr:probable amino acid transporter transmembrane protein [Ralstonia solanacearum IPO1609]